MDHKPRIDIKELFHVLLHKLWIIMFVAFLGALTIGGTNLLLITPIYTSTTRVYIIIRQDETQTTYYDLMTATHATLDFMILMTSSPVLEQIIKSTNVDMSIDELAGMISIINPVGTQMLEISVTDYEPSMAKKLADAVASISSEQLINTMGIEKVNVVEYANLPTAPDGRNLLRSFLMGGVIGIVISSVVIIIVQRNNDIIRSSEDIENNLGISTLGIIPLNQEVNNKKYKRKLRHIKRKTALVS
jgi:capsular polysaccharide biosynthesis protein